eukprot:514593_1
MSDLAKKLNKLEQSWDWNINEIYENPSGKDLVTNTKEEKTIVIDQEWLNGFTSRWNMTPVFDDDSKTIHYLFKIGYIHFINERAELLDRKSLCFHHEYKDRMQFIKYALAQCNNSIDGILASKGNADIKWHNELESCHGTKSPSCQRTICMDCLLLIFQESEYGNYI